MANPTHSIQPCDTSSGGRPLAPAAGTHAAPRRWPPGLRTLITATVLVPLLLIVLTLLSVSGLTTRWIAERLGDSLLENATANVQTDLTRYLSSAVRVSDLYSRRIAAGTLPTESLQPWERYELDDLVTSADIASICFGAATGEATWLLRRDGHYEVGRSEPTGDAVEYIIDQQGRTAPEPLRVYTYDPRQRPWYAAALKSDGPLWTPIYFWFGESGADSDTGAGYTRAIRKPDGTLAGVLVIDVTLGGLSDFLDSLALARSGAIFVTDEQNLLIAASDGPVNTPDGQRLPLGSATTPAALALSGAIAKDQRLGSDRVRMNGEPARVSVTPFHPYPGIDWSIAAVVPESAFLAQAHTLQRRALLASILLVLAGVGLALLMGHNLASPLLALAAHVRHIGAGDFAARIHLRQARELTEVSSAMNTMAAGLRERMELQQALSLATEVQQSLLPMRSPTIPGLDIAGQSRYCETTGGDYYDFIDVADVPRGHVVIAVGDVMGHGIAAALLMATARAALRAHACAGFNLGNLMTGVNAVLARDARHGRFMTMVLIVIEPEKGVMRWATAGHDPPIVYDPGADRFIELKGGDIPLGIDDHVTYKEYTVAPLPPGAIMLLGTDGIWESFNFRRQMFGHDRLRQVIRATAGKSSAEILAAVDTAITDFRQGAPAQDDITAVVLRLTAAPIPVPGRGPTDQNIAVLRTKAPGRDHSAPNHDDAYRYDAPPRPGS